MIVNGIILAAGLSSRMNAFKPLLKLKEKTIIEHSIDSMFNAGVNQVIVVLGHHGKEVENLLMEKYKCLQLKIVHNHEYKQTDMLASLKTGISVLGSCHAFYLLPGDMPAINTKTFFQIRAAMSKTNALAAFPAIDGHRKHPPLISWKCIEHIIRFNGEGGLREIWKQLENQLVTIPVEDMGCMMDADTKEDYKRLVEYMEHM